MDSPPAQARSALERDRLVEPRPHWEPLRTLEFQPTSCPVCGTDRGTLRFAKRIKSVEMRYFICATCKALYANPRATLESLRNLYASADFFEGGTPGYNHLVYSDFLAGEEYLRMTARDRLSRIVRHRPSGRLLEVACAAGFFLAEAKIIGYDVSGIEFSAPMAEYASRRWGVPVVADSAELTPLESDAYDVIASWGVMTIIRDPVALIEKFYRALKPGGIWAFNTYYYDGILPALVGSRWYILVTNFSQLFTRRLIMDLPARAGFRLVSRRREMPYTDLMKVSDIVGRHLNAAWLPRVLTKVGVQRSIVKLPLPDVMEYIWQKP